MTSYQSGMTLARLRRSVERDSYSDFLPLAAWVEEEQAFLTIDDGWGYSWELVPSPYMFAHVHEALLGLLNVNFPEGTILQLQSFADPLIDDALDAFLDLKTRPDPLIQAVRRQNIWHNSRRKLAECGPRPGVDIKRRSCGGASGDVRWSSV